MGHVVADKPKLLARVRRLKGQLEAIERAVESESDCASILQLVASIRGAVNGLTVELIEDHIREHITNAEDGRERQRGAAELVGVIRTYMK